MANEQARELGLDAQIKRGLWAWTVPSDQCLLSKESLICPLGMREVLTPEEWRPIIVAGIFYFRKINERGLMGARFRTLIPYVFLPMIPFAIPIIFLVNTNPLLALALVIAYTPVYVVMAKHGFDLFSPMLRFTMLAADKEANTFLGNDILLEVLKRIDRFGLEDVEDLKTVRARTSIKLQRLSIAQRIENLSASTPPQPNG